MNGAQVTASDGIVSEEADIPDEADAAGEGGHSEGVDRTGPGRAIRARRKNPSQTTKGRHGAVRIVVRLRLRRRRIWKPREVAGRGWRNWGDTDIRLLITEGSINNMLVVS